MTTRMIIEKLDNEGRGIGYKDGKIVFVNNALPKEEVNVQITKEKKKYMEGVTTDIITSNSMRVKPKCPFYDKCGGCNIMHMGIESQENYKLQKSKDILHKYAGIDNEIKLVKSNKELFYRNKITLKVKNGKWGYYNSNTHTLCEINNCLLVNNSINNIISNKNKFNIINGSIVIRCNNKDEVLIAIDSKEKVVIDNDLPSNIIGIVINDKTYYGENYFYDEIGDMKFKISYNSFFQINNYIASEIFKILKFNLSGENLLDLYCGVGVMGLSLKDNFKTIYGIEKIENAILNAKENALINNVENANFFVGDTGSILKKIDKSFDTVIVDPPRSGLNEETINEIMDINPKTIAYISCDQMTLARDLKILTEKYYISKLSVLDMFPNTYHVETVCILGKR